MNYGICLSVKPRYLHADKDKKKHCQFYLDNDSNELSTLSFIF